MGNRYHYDENGDYKGCTSSTPPGMWDEFSVCIGMAFFAVICAVGYFFGATGARAAGVLIVAVLSLVLALGALFSIKDKRVFAGLGLAFAALVCGQVAYWISLDLFK